MHIPMVVTIAVALDALLGEPRRWHPLMGFGRVATALEKKLNRARLASAAVVQLWGWSALLLVVVPPVVLCVLVVNRPYGAIVETIVLYLAIGHRSLRDHARRVVEALQASDLGEAQRRVGMMVSRDTHDMNTTRIAGAAMESVLENGNDALFGVLFWFALLGAPGVLAYRLVNTLDAMWGYRTPRYLNFGRAAARFDDAFNFIPARLTALAYALCGNTAAALRSWKTQARLCESPNAGPVMASGAGALRVRLGGGAFYHGTWKARAELGEGSAPDIDGIRRSLDLLLRVAAIWIAVLWLIGFAVLVYRHA